MRKMNTPASETLCRFAAAGAALLLSACGRPQPAPVYDPLAVAWASAGQIEHAEAVIPAACYTDTADGANPCWTCHTSGQDRNRADTIELQREYAFSEAARDNAWTALFNDRREQAAAFTAADMRAWLEADNYTPLRSALSGALGRRSQYPGFTPDVDLHLGVDEQGFAMDGSGWRSLAVAALQTFSGDVLADQWHDQRCLGAAPGCVSA